MTSHVSSAAPASPWSYKILSLITESDENALQDQADLQLILAKAPAVVAQNLMHISLAGDARLAASYRPLIREAYAELGQPAGAEGQSAVEAACADFVCSPTFLTRQAEIDRDVRQLMQAHDLAFTEKQMQLLIGDIMCEIDSRLFKRLFQEIAQQTGMPESPALPRAAPAPAAGGSARSPWNCEAK